MVKDMTVRCGELLQELERAKAMLSNHQAAGESIVRNILRLEGALTLMKEMGVEPPNGLSQLPVPAEPAEPMIQVAT